MTPQEKFNRKKRVICPNCEGKKTEWRTIDILSPQKYESVTRPCTFCNGEGIMDMTVTYTPINYEE